MLNRLGFLLALLLPLVAHAAHIAEYVVQRDGDGNIVHEKVTARYEVALQDVGRPGAYYLVIEGDRSDYYTQTPYGWEAYLGGIPEPFLEVPALTDGFTLVVFETGQMLQQYGQKICDIMNQNQLRRPRLWIGYGALQDDKAERIERLHSIANPRLPPEHLRRFYIYEDGRAGEKYNQVLMFDCAPQDV